jgi:chromosome segregation ATPase
VLRENSPRVELERTRAEQASRVAAESAAEVAREHNARVALEQQRATLEHARDKAETERAQLTTRLDDLEQALTDAIESGRTAERGLEATTTELRQRTQELAEAHKELAARTHELTDLRRALEDGAQQLTASTHELTDLRRALEDGAQQLTARSSELLEARQSHEAEAARAAASLTELRVELGAEHAQSLADEHARAQTLEEEAARLREELVGVRNELLHLRNDFSAAQRDLATREAPRQSTKPLMPALHTEPPAAPVAARPIPPPVPPAARSPLSVGRVGAASGTRRPSVSYSARDVSEDRVFSSEGDERTSRRPR